jgi:hypothetical protein
MHTHFYHSGIYIFLTLPNISFESSCAAMTEPRVLSIFNFDVLQKTYLLVDDR